jgi:hypothetical protein
VSSVLDEYGSGLPFGGPSEDEKAMLGLGDPPAFLRRGMSVVDAENRVRRQCETAREEMLFAVKLRLRAWNRLTTDRESIRRSMSAEATAAVARLNESSYGPDESKVSIEPTGWPVFAGRRWIALVAAVEDFNRNWRRFIDAFPLDDLHRAIDGYNRYYVLEKECAVRSIHTARRGFTPRTKPTNVDLLGEFPPLETPPPQYR